MWDIVIGLDALVILSSQIYELHPNSSRPLVFSRHETTLLIYCSCRDHYWGLLSVWAVSRGEGMPSRLDFLEPDERKREKWGWGQKGGGRSLAALLGLFLIVGGTVWMVHLLLDHGERCRETVVHHRISRVVPFHVVPCVATVLSCNGYQHDSFWLALGCGSLPPLGPRNNHRGVNHDSRICVLVLCLGDLPRQLYQNPSSHH